MATRDQRLDDRYSEEEDPRLLLRLDEEPCLH